MSTLVLLPSYNERKNLIQLIEALLKQNKEISICVVDDNSPDGTSELVDNYISMTVPEIQCRLKLITRSKKDGRGGAVRDGILWGIKNEKKFSAFVEMDCDFSHKPEDIARGLQLLEKNDVVIGARYPNGTIIGWPLSRKIFSLFSNLLARILINWNIHDYTNGFRFYNRRAAELMSTAQQKNKGYIYLSETLSLMLKNNLKIASFPIVFVNRERGESNTSLSEILSALKGIFKISWEHRFGKS